MRGKDKIPFDAKNYLHKRFYITDSTSHHSYKYLYQCLLKMAKKIVENETV